MKHIHLCLIMICATLAFESTAQKITVVIKNVRNGKGKVGAALYKSKDEFMKTESQTRMGQAKEGEVTLVFTNVPKGEYAVSVLHDENGNGEMDTNAVGIPKEGYGFSNDVMGAFGPPKFDRAKFEVTGDLRIEITMKYF